MKTSIEKIVAVSSFVVATILAFTSLMINDHHDIEAGVCMVIAQFLLLTASIFGINYTINKYGSTNKRDEKQ